jgi:hypothetical protein
VSPRPPWMRLARTTTPAWFRARSGVSKKNTWRGWASTGSIGRPWIVERCSDAGIVTFSSTLSASLMSAMTSESWASDRCGASAGASVAIG